MSTFIKKNILRFQNGAVLIEFALVLPLLLLLLLGIAEFSWAFYHLNILNKSVQDGALYFSEWARCSSTTDCSPNLPINVGSSNPYVANAQNLVITGNPVACNNATNPPLMPLCTNYITPNPADNSNWITQVDTNHIKVTATYQHVFITQNAFSNISRIMFGTTGNFTNRYNLTASSVMRAQ